MKRAGRDGFTMVETLVALVVLSLVMVITVRGVVEARTGLERARATIAAEALARSIVETELARLAPRPGMISGATDGIDWTVTAETIDLPLPPPPAPQQPAQPAARAAGDEGAPAQGTAARGGQADAPDEPPAKWLPLRVRVSVANGRGRPLMVETIHLTRVE